MMFEECTSLQDWTTIDCMLTSLNHTMYVFHAVPLTFVESRPHELCPSRHTSKVRILLFTWTSMIIETGNSNPNKHLNSAAMVVIETSDLANPKRCLYIAYLAVIWDTQSKMTTMKKTSSVRRYYARPLSPLHPRLSSRVLHMLTFVSLGLLVLLNLLDFRTKEDLCTLHAWKTSRIFLHQTSIRSPFARGLRIIYKPNAR